MLNLLLTGQEVPGQILGYAVGLCSNNSYFTVKVQDVCIFQYRLSMLTPILSSKENPAHTGM